MRPRLYTFPQESLLEEAEQVGTVHLPEAVRDLTRSEPELGTLSGNQRLRVLRGLAHEERLMRSEIGRGWQSAPLPHRCEPTTSPSKHNLMSCCFGVTGVLGKFLIHALLQPKNGNYSVTSPFMLREPQHERGAEVVTCWVRVRSP